MLGLISCLEEQKSHSSAPLLKFSLGFLNCLFILGSYGVSVKSESSGKLTTVTEAGLANAAYSLGSRGWSLPTQSMGCSMPSDFTVALPWQPAATQRASRLISKCVFC